MNEILRIIEASSDLLRQKLELVEVSTGFTLDQYVRYLTTQFYLTKDVQRHFFTIASHSSLVDKPKLRQFLVSFGLEEEPHYRIAYKDLENLGQELLPMPIDVKIWWMYFDSILLSRPFVRLGATCILENLGAGSKDVTRRLLHHAPFITERTSRFIEIHMHEELPHGQQVLAALEQSNLTPSQLADLEEGARAGALLYLRMVDWMLKLDLLTTTLLDDAPLQKTTVAHAAATTVPC
ncbi:hypothetical protein [Egbenema bharatensis]|uniref:hypothetical protein n=1 Tax=Egbenema bharatensis TaxID=3463334 RepID=UPI003A87F80C